MPPPEALLTAFHVEVEKAKQEGITIPPRGEGFIERVQRVPGVAHAQRFVDRVRGQGASQEPELSYVQRLEQQTALAAEASKTIH